MFNRRSFTRTLLLTFFLALSASVAFTQTTKFTYQGVLNDNQSPANGTYDFEFKLFSTLSGGAQQGATVTANDVVVSSGQFTVTLDFGAVVFPGADRFLEIGVRAGASVGAYTLLTPRQQLNSTPYAIQSLNAANATNALQLGGTAANQYVLTGDARLTDARNPLPNSANYVQNTTTQQANSNFRISGNGIAGGTLSGNIVNATAQYNLNGTRILSNTGFRNLFAGEDAGFSNPTGGSNSFFGGEAGRSFLTGDGNSFFGRQTGGNLTTGTNNIFIGNNAGASHTTGSWNTVIGANASVVGAGLTYAAALGADAVVETSHTIVLGTAGETVRVPGNLSVTGVLTASGAGLTNLNANNITTGTLATARGGTGLSAPGAAGNYLRSNGTNWTSSALQASDLPSGSANYIQNRTTQQASTNFNISGDGTIGGTLMAGAGVIGNDNSSGGTGVFGGSSSTTGIGVRGQTTAASGLNYGVAGRSDSTTGVGVRGYAAANTGENRGVEGVSDSSTGYGVYGGNNSSGYAGFFSGKSAIHTTASSGIPSSYNGSSGATLSVVHPANNWGLAITRASLDNGHANLVLYKTRNSNASIPTALQAGDGIGRIVWQGPDSANTIRNWAQIETLAQSMGSAEFGPEARMRFSVMQNNVFNNSMELSANGNLSVASLTITGGSDLTEQFEVNKEAGGQHSAVPGMIVSIDPANPGELALSNQAYDRRVAGIISGAGGVKPGMMMGQSGSIADGKHPVALTGRVYCWADASNGSINPGDLLTTSHTPGHAMKASDHQKAQGAIIGKAMTSLKTGKGLVLVLVTLQ